MGDLVLVLLLGGLEGNEAELRRVLGGQMATGESGVLVAKGIPELYEPFTRREVRHAVMHGSQYNRFDLSELPFLQLVFIDPLGDLVPTPLPRHATVVGEVADLSRPSKIPPPSSAPRSASYPGSPDGQKRLQPAQRKVFRALLLARADVRQPEGFLPRERVAFYAEVEEDSVANHVGRLKDIGIHIQTTGGEMRLKRALRPVDHPLALEALTWSAETFGLNEPALIVHRKDADDREFWGPDWDFSIALTNGSITLGSATEPRFSYSVCIELAGDLGIYRNRAKEFLRKHFLEEPQRTAVAKLSEHLHATTVEAVRHGLKDDVSCNPKGPKDFPFRWASGGSLLLARWRERWWALVFFRDLRPVGWNLANGASESVAEQAALLQLIERETMEEVVIVANDPGKTGPSDVITLELERDLSVQEARSALAERLLKAHHDLRRREDGFNLRVSTLSTPVVPLNGPGTIDLIDGGTRKRAGQYLYVTVDPLDFGIEAIQIAKVHLPEHAYILDGEVIEGNEKRKERQRLARRPVGLLSVSFLQRCWEESASLGLVVEAEQDERRMGCKQLPSPNLSRDISKTELHIFQHDYHWRKARVDAGKSDDDQWIDKFGEDFEGFFSAQQASPTLRTLCPVTWKVLEQAFARGDLLNL